MGFLLNLGIAMISSVMNCDQIVLPAGLNITTEEKNMKRTISLCMTRYVIKLTFLCVTSYREFKSERTLFQQYDLIVLLFFFCKLCVSQTSPTLFVRHTAVYSFSRRILSTLYCTTGKLQKNDILKCKLQRYNL